MWLFSKSKKAKKPEISVISHKYIEYSEIKIKNSGIVDIFLVKALDHLGIEVVLICKAGGPEHNYSSSIIVKQKHFDPKKGNTIKDGQVEYALLTAEDLREDAIFMGFAPDSYRW